jgi:hypothetical protein
MNRKNDLPDCIASARFTEVDLRYKSYRLVEKVLNQFQEEAKQDKNEKVHHIPLVSVS